MSTDQIKNDIISMLQKRGNGLSFVNLNSIQGFSGTHELYNPDKNVVLWSDMSLEAVEAISSLIDDRIIELIPTSPLTYHVDGKLLKYPLVKSDRAYKKTRWLPTSINMGKNFTKNKGA